MPITQGLTTEFKLNCLLGLENFMPGGSILIGNIVTPVVYKIALYNASANLDSTTTEYTTDNEISGSGYTAGGEVLTPVMPALNQNAYTAYASFENVTWNPASFTCRGALIYNSSTNAAVAVLNFGADKTATNSFTITFPVADASNAIIRIS